MTINTLSEGDLSGPIFLAETYRFELRNRYAYAYS